MNRTSLYLYVSSKTNSLESTKRTVSTQSNVDETQLEKRSQICVFCTPEPKWSLEQVMPSVESLDTTCAHKNDETSVSHPGEQTVNRSSSVSSVSQPTEEERVDRWVLIVEYCPRVMSLKFVKRFRKGFSCMCETTLNLWKKVKISWNCTVLTPAYF